MERTKDKLAVLKKLKYIRGAKSQMQNEIKHDYQPLAPNWVWPYEMKELRGKREGSEVR